MVQVKESSKAGHVEVLLDLKRWLQGKQSVLQTGFPVLINGFM